MQSSAIKNHSIHEPITQLPGQARGDEKKGGKTKKNRAGMTKKKGWDDESKIPPALLDAGPILWQGREANGLSAAGSKIEHQALIGCYLILQYLDRLGIMEPMG